MSTGLVGRPATGEVLRTWRKRAQQWHFAIRFRYVHPDTGERERERITLGLEEDGWNEITANRKLEEYLQQARAGVYRPPVESSPPRDLDPTFHEFSSHWLEQKRAELSKGAYDDYRNLLVRHLLPFFATSRLTEITYERVQEYRAERLRTSRALRQACEAGFPLIEHDARGRERRQPIFGARQINASIDLLARILARAVKSDSYLLDRNSATDAELRVKRKKQPARRHLEADEVLDLLAAAIELDNPVSVATVERARLVQHLRDVMQLKWKAIAAELGCAEATAIWLYRRQAEPSPERQLRTAIALLTLAGGRNQETAWLTWDELDFSHQRIVVDESKSRPREIEMSPFLVEELMLHHRDLARRPAGRDLVLLTRDGKRRTRHNLNHNVIKPVVERANQRRQRRGVSTLPPNITPHTLRRTFVTMSAQRGKSLSWIVGQIGHHDFTTTHRYYLQATSLESLPHIQRCLRALFGPRDVICLDELDRIRQLHSVDSLLTADPSQHLHGVTLAV
jgi:integrase